MDSRRRSRRRRGRAGGALAHPGGESAHAKRWDADGPAAGDGPSRVHLPAGWPEGVLPPLAPGWEQSASAWLFGCCPPDYRAYPVLRRHPVILARFAADFVEGQIRSNRRALSRARTGVDDDTEPRMLDSATAMLEADDARLIRARRAVALVEEALRGKVFIRNLQA